MRAKKIAAAAVLATVCLIPLQASAACVLYWAGRWWTLAESSCQDVANAGLAGTCFTNGAIAFSPGTDYLTTTGGRVFLVRGGTTSPLSFVGAKLSGPKIPADPKARAASAAAFNQAFAKAKDLPVSSDELARFARASRLEVRQMKSAPAS